MWTAGCSSSSTASAGTPGALGGQDELMCRSIDEARETYEELVATFPTSGRYWKAYIEQVQLQTTCNVNT